MKTKPVKTKQENGVLGESVTDEQRHRMIAEAAYFRALQRDFQGGDALEDWCCAERDIDQLLLPREVPARSRVVEGDDQASAKRPANRSPTGVAAKI